MDDFPMKFETMIRKIFQCGRFDDPLGRLANTDNWSALYSKEFSKIHTFKTWAVLSRLQLQYLDSITGREELYERADMLEDRLLKATTNIEILDIMNEITEIVDTLGLSEFPHISYQATNDNSST